MGVVAATQSSRIHVRVRADDYDDYSISGWDRRSVFYELLRPELVRKYPRQLSSDAFSNWQLHEPRMKTYSGVCVCVYGVHADEPAPRRSFKLMSLVHTLQTER
jgi:hypothetical protein